MSSISAIFTTTASLQK